MDKLIFLLLCLLFPSLCIAQTDARISFEAKDAKDLEVKIRVESKNQYLVRWGDGFIDTIQSNELAIHSYESPFSGDVIFEDVIGPDVRKVQLKGQFKFDIKTLYSWAIFIDTLIIGNDNLCYGNLASKPTTLLYIDMQKGDFYGNFNRSRLKNMKRLRVVDGNKITLNIGDFDKSINYIGVTGENEMYGSIDSLDLPKLTHLDVKGRNSITGDIGKMISVPPIFVLRGNQSMDTYTPGEIKFTSRPQLINISSPNSQLDSDEIDNLIIDIDKSAPIWKGPKAIFLDGEHLPPTDKSLQARQSLIEKGVKIYTN